MTRYQCPVCSKRACDSDKLLSLARFSEESAEIADVVIKCHNCKSTLAITVRVEASATRKMKIS